MQHQADTKFAVYTRRKYFSVLFFLLFSMLTIGFGILLYWQDTLPFKIILACCVFMFAISIACMIKYEPKKFFSDYSDKDKVLKSFEMGKQYALDISKHVKGFKRITNDILFQEVAHANAIYLAKLDHFYSNMHLEEQYAQLEDFVKIAKDYYTKNTINFCYHPAKYIEFATIFTHCFKKILNTKDAEIKADHLNIFKDFLLHFTLEQQNKKTLVQLVGNNWHRIILILVIVVLIIALLDVTFEMGFKLDRYLAVGSAIPTLYLLNNYNPFK